MMNETRLLDADMAVDYLRQRGARVRFLTLSPTGESWWRIEACGMDFDATSASMIALANAGIRGRPLFIQTQEYASYR